MQKKAIKLLVLELMLMIVPVISQAQQIESILNTTETKYMQEKVYLHTDKSTYTSGETVWFKAYLAADNLAAPLSKTLYAELINDNGAVLQRRMMPVLLAGAAGDFIIPDSLNDTRLFIRAYTAWMLNFDSSLLCVKPIHLVSKKGLVKKAPTPDVYTLTFFPEGGDLVTSVESHVAFKATDPDGTPISIKGDIIDNKNKKLFSFASLHDGMGFIILQPVAGETYRAVWKDRKGVKHETTLPDAKKEGVVLTIGFPGNQLHYSLSRPDSVSGDYTRFTVVAQMQQRQMYGAQINMSKRNNVTAPLPTDSMPDGVLQITVFNAGMVPVAERLVFVNNNNYSFITDLHLNQQNFTKRARNELQIDAGGSLLTNLSVAVTDADINPVGKNESTIYSHFLLSSDLKGFVYNPAYYFSSDADSVKQHLDLVMMTNGWRRFSWQKLLADQWPALNYLPEKYLSIQGKVIGLSRTLLYNKELTTIIKTKNNQPDFLNIPIDDKGNFGYGSLYFFDTAKLYYQLSNDKDRNLTSTATFNFKNSFVKAPVLTKDILGNLYLPDRTDSVALVKSNNIAALRRAQEAASKVETLQEVRVVTKTKSLKQKLDEQYTSGFFSGGDAQTFTTEDDPFAKTATSLLAYLQGKVAGLQISTAGQGSATWRNSPTSLFLNESPADIGTLQSLTMADVILVKVFRPPFFGAAGGGAGGAIAVYTNKGGASNASFVALPSATLYGYSVIRQFYSPDYITNPDLGTKDFRTTLYWNPNVHFDKNNRRFTVPFFNSDQCKKFRVIVEGINENGVFTREEKIFQ